MSLTDSSSWSAVGRYRREENGHNGAGGVGSGEISHGLGLAPAWRAVSRPSFLMLLRADTKSVTSVRFFTWVWR